MSRVALVACVKSKKAETAPASQLYDSPWFRKVRAYARETCDRWYILSAKHGVLRPTETVSPYKETLRDFSADRRRTWADRVLRELDEVLSQEDEVVILAGLRYREHLVSPIEERTRGVEVPMEGLGIGEQLQFLNERLKTFEDRRGDG